MKTNHVEEINESEFEREVLHSRLPVLVGFLAGWSQPCRLVEPVLEKVAKACSGSARVLKVNVDDNPDLGTWYGIQSVPTVSYFINGTVREQIVGIASTKAFLAKLQSLAREQRGER